jgi:hypothetical protein
VTPTETIAAIREVLSIRRANERTVEMIREAVDACVEPPVKAAKASKTAE